MRCNRFPLTLAGVVAAAALGLAAAGRAGAATLHLERCVDEVTAEYHSCMDDPPRRFIERVVHETVCDLTYRDGLRECWLRYSKP